MSRPAAVCLLFVFAFFFILIGSDIRIEFQDDGASALGAWRVASGDLPYRDFMTVYMPAHHYVMAGLFRIFGPSLLVERVWQSLMWAGTVTLIACLVAGGSSWVFGLISSLMALVLIGRFSHVPGPIPSALFYSMLSAYLLLKGLSGAGRAYPFLAGLASGLAFLYRQDLGTYSVLAAFTTLALCHDPDKRHKGDVRRFLAGALLVTAPVGLFFVTQVPLGDLFFCLVYFPLKIYPAHHRLTYPPLELGQLLSETTFYFYFTPVVMALSVLFLFAGWHRPRGEGASRRLWPKILFSILGCLFLNQAKFRPDAVHLLPAYLCATALFGWILYAVHERKKTLWVVAVCFIISWYLLPAFWYRLAFFFEKPAKTSLLAPRAKGIDVFPFSEDEWRIYRDYERSIEYVRSKIRPGEKIFVGSVRHDRVCAGDPLFYFLAQADSATRHQELVRGVVTTEAAQRQIIQEMESAPARYAVLRKTLDDRCVEPNESSAMNGSHLLDGYLAQRYVEEAVFGGDRVLVRKDEAV